jgi:hypothetical protein
MTETFIERQNRVEQIRETARRMAESEIRFRQMEKGLKKEIDRDYQFEEQRQMEERERIADEEVEREIREVRGLPVRRWRGRLGR